jgi:hypothetical protein
MYVCYMCIFFLVNTLNFICSIRILLMPPVYAVISFFSYRYFRSYTYYELAETAYEVRSV